MEIQTVRDSLPRVPIPRRPDTLPELAEETLTALSSDPSSEQIILGGGIALKHYDDFRSTQDIDAWWRTLPDVDALTRFEFLLGPVAGDRGLTLAKRRFGTTDSLEFSEMKSGRKIFSFQIAVRDIPLEVPILSAWPPIAIETFLDNVGSKMNALVNRGAPRDFVDIFRIVEDGLISADGCWGLWRLKNEVGEIHEAKGKVLTHLARLELRRPLDSIGDGAERGGAEYVRNWYRNTFLQGTNVERDDSLHDGID